MGPGSLIEKHQSKRICIMIYLSFCVSVVVFFLIGSGNPGHQSNQGHQDREVCQDAKGTFLCVPVLKVMFGKVHMSVYVGGKVCLFVGPTYT